MNSHLILFVFGLFAYSFCIHAHVSGSVKAQTSGSVSVANFNDQNGLVRAAIKENLKTLTDSIEKDLDFVTKTLNSSLVKLAFQIKESVEEDLSEVLITLVEHVDDTLQNSTSQLTGSMDKASDNLVESLEDISYRLQKLDNDFEGTQTLIETGKFFLKYGIFEFTVTLIVLILIFVLIGLFVCNIILCKICCNMNKIIKERKQSHNLYTQINNNDDEDLFSTK